MNSEKIKKNYSKLPQMDFHLCFDRLLSGRPPPLLVAFKWAAQYRGQTLDHLAAANWWVTYWIRISLL
jgi:hypothetical protein